MFVAKRLLAEIARNMPQEQRDKISKSLTGRKLHPERAQQARTAALGRKNTPEQIANMVEANKKRRKEVFCETNGQNYPSVRDAGRETGIHESTIGANCRGRLKRAGGLVFRYVND